MAVDKPLHLFGNTRALRLYNFTTQASYVDFLTTSAGGLTITPTVAAQTVTLANTANLSIGGTLAVTGTSTLTGRMAIGGALQTDTALYVESVAATAGTTRYGFAVAGAFPSGVTGSGIPGQFTLVTAASAFTMSAGYGINIGSPVIQAPSIVTTIYGLRVNDQTGGGTNYAIYTGAGLVRLGGAVTAESTLAVTGTSALTGHVGIGGASSASASLLTKAATTALSSVRLPHGAAPTAPVDGDMWTTTTGLFIRINGVTVGPLT